VLVLGLGNSLRHDDAAGLEVVRRVAQRTGAGNFEVCEHEGEPLALLELWRDAEAVLLVDAVSSGAAPGTLHRADASSQPIPALLRSSTSTHAVGIADAIELARALRRLPGRVLLFGIEGRRFDAGSGLSEEVAGAVGPLAEAVLSEVRELAALGT
jgi:hydrogenase maturation protease